MCVSCASPSEGQGAAPSRSGPRGPSLGCGSTVSKLGSGIGGWRGLACCGRITCLCFTTVLGGLEEPGRPAGGACGHEGRPAAGAREVPLWVCYEIEPIVFRAGLDLGGGLGVKHDSRFLA